ncbi:unnamed protein product [Parnassius mnemosyne]|uniref:Uncharacterized protein n=1 Tax=Parnassius mnemosyne TaxID=213953 RepID=A0AAV1L1F6_9NEOP
MFNRELHRNILTFVTVDFLVGKLRLRVHRPCYPQEILTCVLKDLGQTNPLETVGRAQRDTPRTPSASSDAVRRAPDFSSSGPYGPPQLRHPAL